MIRLNKTTTKLEVVLGGAASAQAQCCVSYYDIPSQTKEDFSEYRGAVQLASSNSTTDATICSAPSANTVRNIDYASIYNPDSGTAVATVMIDDGGTNTKLFTKTLLSTQSLVYTRANGWS